MKTIAQFGITFWQYGPNEKGKLYGKDYDEQWAIALETTWAEVTQIYKALKHYVNDAESAILHARPLEQILTWTKAHLDAYLATAEVILTQDSLSTPRTYARAGWDARRWMVAQ
jgi:hypothetical protein